MAGAMVLSLSKRMERRGFQGLSASAARRCDESYEKVGLKMNEGASTIVCLPGVLVLGLWRFPVVAST
jgi:hypothetical protein